MSAICVSRKLALSTAAALVIQLAAGVHAAQASDKAPESNASAATSQPIAPGAKARGRSAEDGSISTLYKAMYLHFARLQQIETAMRKLEFEYRNGGGCFPSEAFYAPLRQKYDNLRTLRYGELQTIATLRTCIRQVEAAGR